MHAPFEGGVWAAQSETSKNRRQLAVLGLFRPEIVPGGPPTLHPFARNFLNRFGPAFWTGAFVQANATPTGQPTPGNEVMAIQIGAPPAPPKGRGARAQKKLVKMTVQIAIQSDERQAAVFQQVACLVRGALRPDAGWFPLQREQAAKAY